MGAQAFDLGQAHDVCGFSPEGLGGIVEHAGALEKVVDGESRGEARRAGRRQHMVGTGDIIADGLGGVLADENRAGVPDLGQARKGVAEVKLEVFGRHAVGAGLGLRHVPTTKIEPNRLIDSAAISSRSNSDNCCSTITRTASARDRDVVTRTAEALESCSAWERRSAAMNSGSAESSATTRTSLGPAMMSMPTVPATIFLARLT